MSTENGVKINHVVDVTTKIEDVDSSGNSIVKNIRNDKTLKLSESKKDSLCYTANALLNNNFEPEFIAGVLGNIMSEGEYGLFESSNYKNPDRLPKYFKYMKEYLKNLNYDTEFSGKKILSVGLKKTCKLVDFTVKSNYQAKFGFGAAQFTGDRATEIIKKYIEVCGNVTKEHIKNNYVKKEATFLEKACEEIFKGKEVYPTAEQMLKAESDLIVEELKGVKKVCYEDWKGKYKNKDNSVNMSGQIICLKYEIPHDRENQAIIRGNNSDSIYKVMMKK